MFAFSSISTNFVSDESWILNSSAFSTSLSSIMSKKMHSSVLSIGKSTVTCMVESVEGEERVCVVKKEKRMVQEWHNIILYSS